MAKIWRIKIKEYVEIDYIEDYENITTKNRITVIFEFFYLFMKHCVFINQVVPGIWGYEQFLRRFK